MGVFASALSSSPNHFYPISSVHGEPVQVPEARPVDLIILTIKTLLKVETIPTSPNLGQDPTVQIIHVNKIILTQSLTVLVVARWSGFPGAVVARALLV